MADDGFEQTRHGLIRKRASLVSEVSEIEALQASAAQKVANLHALEAVIRVFDPDIDLEAAPIRRIPPAYAAFRGEMARFFLAMLREHPAGQTTHELALAIMRSRQISTADLQAVKLMQRRTGHSLLRLRKNGYVISDKATAGGLLRWRLSVKGERGGPVGGWRNGSVPQSRPL
jgi:hypothetical protein